MTKKLTDYDMAMAALEGLESKGIELVHRARLVRRAVAHGDTEPLTFFTAMAIESAKAAAFWAEVLEKNADGLAKPTGDLRTRGPILP